ncbi:glycosyl hydrolase family 61-domain-containing protein [Xylaria acuta]|nr:glycosyl hydrolase family 61-domain-containing protein [Xylaria acuta]
MQSFRYSSLLAALASAATSRPTGTSPTSQTRSDSGDIVCHKTATPAGGYVQAAAGDSISTQWDTWPESHKGPMLDYLAACNGPCDSVDKLALEFFKIDDAGILDSSSAPGTWASDVLIENNTWLVQVPKNLKAGNYLLRHETIALHSAGQTNGAQNYSQCFNLEVTGSGTEVPAGVLATELYTPTDPGIEVNIYVSGLDYQIPSPTLISGVSSTIAQSSSAIATSASATVGSGSGSGPGFSSAAATTTAAAQATTSDAAPSSTAAQSSTSLAVASSSSSAPAKPTTTLVASTRAASSSSTTTAASTSEAPSTTAASTATKTQTGDAAAQTLYGHACPEGTCTEYNPYYSQCIEASAAALSVVDHRVI